MSRINYRLKLLELAITIEEQIPPPPTDKGARLDVVRAAKLEVIKNTAAELEEWILQDTKNAAAAPTTPPGGYCTIIVTDGEKRSYDVKDILKEMGFIWDKSARAWIAEVPKDEAGAIIASRSLDGLTIKVEE